VINRFIESVKQFSLYSKTLWY